MDRDLGSTIQLGDSIDSSHRPVGIRFESSMDRLKVNRGGFLGCRLLEYRSTKTMAARSPESILTQDWDLYSEIR